MTNEPDTGARLYLGHTALLFDIAITSSNVIRTWKIIYTTLSHPVRERERDIIRKLGNLIYHQAKQAWSLLGYPRTEICRAYMRATLVAITTEGSLGGKERQRCLCMDSGNIGKINEVSGRTRQVSFASESLLLLPLLRAES